MQHCPAGIDDVGHIALPIGSLRRDEGLVQPADHPRRIVQSQQDGADHIPAHRPHPMRQEQPALAGLNGRPAIAQLNEFPWKRWLKD